MKKPSQEKILTYIIFILTLSTFIKTQNTTPEEKEFAGTYGVGAGVVVIFIFFLIGICICVAGKATSSPLQMTIIGTLLPIIVFLIIYLLPKEADKPTVDSNRGETDFTPIRNSLFYGFVLGFSIIGKKN